MRTTLLLFLLAGAIPAQPFGFGVKGGIRLTDDLDPYLTSLSKRYVVGPTASFRLPAGFRLEIDALYRRLGDRVSFGTIHTFFIEQEYGNSWEFPLLVRRTLWHNVFAGAGFAPRVISGGMHVIQYGYVPVSYGEFDAPADWRSAVAFVAAAGIEKRVAGLRIAPELRYSRWNHSPTTVSNARRHQMDVMLSIELVGRRR
jgi:hypothetical protein